jgi:prolyl 4-hydroxylase
METLETLETRALAGDSDALLMLGKRSLIGQAGVRSQGEGARMLLAAAEKGCAEADTIISVVIATDAKEAKDWSLALGYVQRAAERGSSLAREQLCLLARDRDLAAAARSFRGDNAIWEKLRDTIDLAALLKAPVVKYASSSPRIAVVENFASAAECSWMIARGALRMNKAGIYNQVTGAAQVDASRTNSAMLFNILDTDFVLTLLRARIAAATGFARPSLEETNVLHYACGESFVRHFDFYDAALPASAAEIAAKGQRAATFLIYLNDDFVGAQTDFPSLGWRYRGKAGDALLFFNTHPSGGPDILTMHAGLPPSSGEKWLLSQWLRSAPGFGL